MYSIFVQVMNCVFRKHFYNNFNISLQNVVAWTNLGTLYLKKDNIEVCVITLK